MPYIPTDTDCEELNPSMCGGKMQPTMDYSFTCTGCVRRPYGDCLDELLIPDICDVPCIETVVNPSLHVTVQFNSEPKQVGENLYIESTVINDGDVTVEDVVAEVMGERIELGTLETEDYFTSAVIHTLTAEDVATGYVTVTISAQGYYEGETVEDSATETYSTECEYAMSVEVAPTDGVTYDYHVGDTMSFNIILNNDGSCVIEDITVNIPINNTQWLLDDVEAQESVTYSRITHTIRESDVVDGRVYVTITAESESGLIAITTMIVNIL